jgi:hypothetical protein
MWRRVLPRIVMFDLDRTLWRDYTAEYHRGTFDPHEVAQAHVPMTHRAMLRGLQADGHELHVCSRSSDPERCKQILGAAYADIQFTTVNIFPTAAETKAMHVSRALRGDPWNTPFAFYDDEEVILRDMQSHFPNARAFLCRNGVGDAEELAASNSSRAPT